MGGNIEERTLEKEIQHRCEQQLIWWDFDIETATEQRERAERAAMHEHDTRKYRWESEIGIVVNFLDQ